MSDSARILVVDDDPSILGLLADLLSPFYTVFTKYDAVEAIQQLDWEPVDLLIIDLNMPVLLGEEAIRMIKNRPGGYALPVLAISGDREIHQRLLGTDVQAIVEKPFSTDRLLHIVEDLLERSRQVTAGGSPLVRHEPVPPEQDGGLIT